MKKRKLEHHFTKISAFVSKNKTAFLYLNKPVYKLQLYKPFTSKNCFRMLEASN